MSQYYPRPDEVMVDTIPNFWQPTSFELRKLKEGIARDGLIVPILVNEVSERLGITHSRVFEAADQNNAERIIVCRELGFETILVEDEWEEDDL